MRIHLTAILLVIASSRIPRGAAAPDLRVGSERRIERAVRVSDNDNRIPAGVFHGDVLTLRLVARVARWYPDGDAAPGALVQAFAEEGHAPLVPGPLIRVRAGTEVSITLRNIVPNAVLTVHGLISRSATGPTSDDTVQLAAGATRSLRIRLDKPGTYYYWGTTTGRSMVYRTHEDAQLTGAIVVDSATGTIPVDRVMVIGMWSDTAGRALVVRTRLLSVINGRSWPHTERLAYAVGDSVRWRIINASSDSHPMHLHGFYFRVDSRGNGLADTTYAENVRDHVVTNLLTPGTTMSMSWSPDRPGNWLFHCHLPEHFERRGPLGMPPAPAAEHAHGVMNHALEGMNGLVIGITIHAIAGHEPPIAASAVARRKMRLLIRPSRDGSAASPIFEFVLQGDGARAVIGTSDRIAPPIVLVRGEPVSITVVNTLTEPTAVHWHGIELESYYDGVAGFSGTGKRISPVIAPSDSFEVRFAPPRAGTFIYHTHIDERRQQPAGLAGPIIVLDTGQRYDAMTDLTVVASTPRDSTGAIPRFIWLKGSWESALLTLQQGVRYRLRLINMTTHSPGLRFELRDGATIAQWRPLAKDGADLPIARQVAQPARQPVSIGETADLEFIPEHPGEHRLEAHLNDGTLVGTIVVRVSAGAAAPRE